MVKLGGNGRDSLWDPLVLGLYGLWYGHWSDSSAQFVGNRAAQRHYAGHLVPLSQLPTSELLLWCGIVAE